MQFDPTNSIQYISQRCTFFEINKKIETSIPELKLNKTFCKTIGEL